MALYRGKTTTMQKIQAAASIQITNTEEAVAYLRSMSNNLVQIATIMQRNKLTMSSLKNAQTQLNQPSQPAELVDTSVAVEEVSADKPISFDDEEQHTETQKEARLAKLRKATKKTEDKESK